MARSRSVRYKQSREKSGYFAGNITSLLDILTIFIVFLIYIQKTEINKPVLPNAVSIKISRSQIWVDEQEVLNTDADATKTFDDGGKRIIPLFQRLSTLKAINPQTQLANLIVDKTLKYNYLKRVMYTCHAAGFKDFKFAVLAERAD